MLRQFVSKLNDADICQKFSIPWLVYCSPRMQVEDLQARTVPPADQGPHCEEETKPRLGIQLALFEKA